MRLSTASRVCGVVLAGVAITGCDLWSPTDGAGRGRVTVTIPPLSMPVGLAGQAVGPDDEVVKYHVSVYLSRAELLLLDRRVDAREMKALSAGKPGDPELQLEIEFPLPADALPDDLYGVEVLAYTGSGTLAYQVGPMSFSLSDVFGRASVVDAQAVYVGPGSEAVAIQISLANQSLLPGGTSTVTCSGLNVQGAPTFQPLLPAATRLSSANDSIVVVESRTLVRAVAPGFTQLICELDFGTHDTDTVGVFVSGGVTGSIKIGR